MDKEVYLKAEMISKSFSNGGVQQHILKNLDIELYKGDFTIIMGSSGAGKSTLLYTLSGLDKPSLGKIYFAGEEISEYSNDRLALFRRKHCGFVFQQIYLNDSMSLLDNILMSGYLVNKNRKQVVKKAKKLLQEVGLKEEDYGKFVTQLSGGEAQRGGIVRALINEPEIVFADEPTGALNSTNAKRILDIMTETNKNGQTVLMTTHDIKTALRGNRILYLKDGIIVNEINLGRFTSNDDKERLDKLKSFLEDMGW